MVRELFALAEKAQKQQTKPPGHGKKQQWYFFFVSTFWVYFRWDHVAHHVSDALLLKLPLSCSIPQSVAPGTEALHGPKLTRAFNPVCTTAIELRNKK